MAFSKPDFLERATRRLAPVEAVFEQPLRTDYDLNPDWRLPPSGEYRRAAVLVGLIDRGEDFSVLLTLRPETMPAMPGRSRSPAGGSRRVRRRCRRRCGRPMKRSGSIPQLCIYWGRATPT